jgi:hypothetical protein
MLALSRGRAHLHNFKQKQEISIRFSDQWRFDLAINTLRRYEVWICTAKPTLEQVPLLVALSAKQTLIATASNWRLASS